MRLIMFHLPTLPPFVFFLGKAVLVIIGLMLLVLGVLKIRNHNMYGGGPGPK